MTDIRTATTRRSGASPAGGSTASRGRPDRAAAGSWPVRERSLIGPVLGIPPLVAVALAVGLTAVGVFVDLLRVGTVGTIFQIAYGTGCVLAVAWVRRRSIFVPAIQPPLLLAVVVPVLAVLVGAPSSTAGVTEHLLLAGAPLINAFPAMAVTTVLVLLLAGFRLLRQRTGPDDAVGLLRARLTGRRAEPSTPAGRPARDRASGPEPDRGEGAARRKPARDPDRAGPEAGPEKGRKARARTDGRDGAAPRDGTRKPDGSRRSPRSEGPRDRADGGPSDQAGRRSSRDPSGLSGQAGDGQSRGGQSRGGRPTRRTGSDRPPDDSTRSRRPRPPDPT